MRSVMTIAYCVCFCRQPWHNLHQSPIPQKTNDSLRRAVLWANAACPFIRNSKMSGVFPVTGIIEKPDPAIRYKLLMNLTEWEKDSAG